MTEHRLGIIMNGATGRMGTNQHLIRSILAIMEQGGVTLENGDTVMPDPILVGRNPDKVSSLAKTHNIDRWDTNMERVLENKEDTLFFDSASTNENESKVDSDSIQVESEGVKEEQESVLEED